MQPICRLHEMGAHQSLFGGSCVDTPLPARYTDQRTPICLGCKGTLTQGSLFDRAHVMKERAGVRPKGLARLLRDWKDA